MMKRRIVFLALGACSAMAVVDAVIQPGYFWKSVSKIFLFLVLPIFLVYRKDMQKVKSLFSFRKSGGKSVLLGIAVYIAILAGYFLLRSFFDFSFVTGAMEHDLGVNADNFPIVSLYISFANSLLEEFFFRGMCFLTLKDFIPHRAANLFSAVLFALYHVAMLLGWFRLDLMLLLIMGLVIAGLMFNFLDRKSETLSSSWFVHMFANFAINTVGFILLGII